MRGHPDITFAILMDAIIDAKGIKICELTKRTGYSKSTFRKIRYENHIPLKQTVITIGIALELNLEQMEVFMFKAGCVFCPSINNDIHYVNVIEDNWEDGASRVIDCNIKLQELGLMDRDLLGNFK